MVGLRGGGQRGVEEGQRGRGGAEGPRRGTVEQLCTNTDVYVHLQDSVTLKNVTRLQ